MGNYENMSVEKLLDEASWAQGYGRPDLMKKIHSIVMKRLNVLEKAVESACRELADHQCPEEFGLATRTECATCPKGKEVHYDAQRDIDCWRRYLMEQGETEK